MSHHLEFFTHRPRRVQWELPFVIVNKTGARPYSPKPPRPFKDHVRPEVRAAWDARPEDPRHQRQQRRFEDRHAMRARRKASA